MNLKDKLISLKKKTAVAGFVNKPYIEKQRYIERAMFKKDS